MDAKIFFKLRTYHMKKKVRRKYFYFLLAFKLKITLSSVPFKKRISPNGGIGRRATFRV